jgi:hypothetical protein
MEKRNMDLSRKMANATKGTEKEKTRSIVENTSLITHCNELRKVSCLRKTLTTTPDRGCLAGLLTHESAVLVVQTNIDLRREVARLRTVVQEQHTTIAKNNAAWNEAQGAEELR